MISANPNHTSRAGGHGEACDWVLSRDEHDANGELVWRRVLRRFVRESLVLNLHVRGQLIGTTAEHPFYGKDYGWLPLQCTVAGDYVWSEASGWLCVEAVEDTGVCEFRERFARSLFPFRQFCVLLSF